MNLAKLAQELNLHNLTPEVAPDGDITAGYASDLLSDVLAHAPAGGVLITVQVHLNVVAVASHANLRAVIFTSNRIPEPEVLDRASSEGISLYASSEDTFDIVGRLYALGVRSKA
jgi:hypothetical protein